MTAFEVTWCYTKGMRAIIHAKDKQEAVELMKLDHDEGDEMDHEIQNIEVCEV